MIPYIVEVVVGVDADHDMIKTSYKMRKEEYEFFRESIKNSPRIKIVSVVQIGLWSAAQVTRDLLWGVKQ